MNERLVTEDRRCRRCQQVMHVTSAELKEHAAGCDGPPPPETTVERRERRQAAQALRSAVIANRLPRMSQRQRMRQAAWAMQMAGNARMITCAILAQKGGEIIVTKGTIEQVRPDMDFEVVVSPTNENERIVRLLTGVKGEVPSEPERIDSTSAE